MSGIFAVVLVKVLYGPFFLGLGSLLAAAGYKMKCKSSWPAIVRTTSYGLLVTLACMFVIVGAIKIAPHIHTHLPGMASAGH